MFPKYFTQICLIFLTWFFRDHKLLIFINLIFFLVNHGFFVFYLRNLCLTQCPIQKNWPQALKRYFYSYVRCKTPVGVCHYFLWSWKRLESPWALRDGLPGALSWDPWARMVPSCLSQAGPLDLLALITAIPLGSLIWFLSLPILPRISHPEPPTQPLSQSPSFHPIRNQVPWGEGWGSEVHSLRLSKNVFRHTVKTSECKSVEWKLCILASVPASVPLPGGREKTMCS